MTISIIHPSRSRPEQALKTYMNWLNKADSGEDIEYNFALDPDDLYLDEYKRLISCTYGWLNIHSTKTAIEAINKTAKVCMNDLFVIVSDDFDCPEHWDTLLLEAMKCKSDFCVKTKDGFQKTLMTLPIMDRAYYERFGYIYNPIYQHMYADQEMTAVAMMLGRNINVDLEFTHNHYLNRKREKDNLDVRNSQTMLSGKQIYNQRVKENFGIEKPVIQYNQIKWR